MKRRAVSAPPGGPEMWAVAGCLFEIVLPGGGWSWRGLGPGPQVTMLDEHDRPTGRHFRFRAEEAGEVELLFRREDAAEAGVVVRMAPELTAPGRPAQS